MATKTYTLNAGQFSKIEAIREVLVGLYELALAAGEEGNNSSWHFILRQLAGNLEEVLDEIQTKS